MNNENLKPFTKTTAKENGRKGGIASGKIRHKDKDFKELVETLAHQPITDQEAIKELAAVGLDADIRSLIFYKIYKQATKENNYKAQQKLFDTFLITDLNPFTNI